MAKNLGVGTGEVASMVGSFARLNEGSAETARKPYRINEKLSTRQTD